MFDIDSYYEDVEDFGLKPRIPGDEPKSEESQKLDDMFEGF